MLCRQALAECVATSEKTAQETETGDPIIRLKRKKVPGKGNTRSSSAVSGPSFEATSEAGADATDSISDGESDGLDENIKIFERLLQRSALEEEVLLLHKRLEEELELHSVLETAVAHVPGTLTSFPYHLPIAAQELLADIAVLEVAVLKLKEKSTALRSQVVQEQTKREIAELHRERSGPILQPKGQGSPHLNPLKDRQCQSAESCQQLKNLEEGKDHISPNGDNVQSLFSFHDRHSMKPSNIRHCLTPTGTATCEYRLSGMGSGLQFCPVTSLTCTRTEGEDRREPSDLVKTPNQLSERMVHSMVSIYCHLAVQNVISGKSSPSGSIHSPTSPFGHQSNSSASSLSESSLVSFVRSPLVDLRNEEVILADATLDPFKVRNNIPWMDIGAYGHVFEVPRLSLDEDQLNYVAQALQDFKLLVEQLASVDPSHLSHDEKLAFWINLYNTLMMDGYLTYGIPQSELKFFSLLQKVAYTVGGHLFSAAMIEYSLLKSKSSATHPQIMLSMALHRNKFTEAQRKFGIDRPEPLINFALCCGTWSAPMVRIYTAEKVHMQLEDAFHNYTQASVGISTTGKLLVPKLLQCYAQNFVEDSDLLDWICNLLPSSQVDVICECIQQQHHHIFGSSNITIVPFNFTFRYLFHADIARTLTSL
ncbi:unnamed protein product [Sphagnum jensenii]|uniref:Uncharacterized protein n=1 Tax=Sphagnum jensenii TaxID=128206 RepID=A0ABP1A4D9_9BRYO